LPDLQRPLWLQIALFAGSAAVSLACLVAAVLRLPVMPAAPILGGLLVALVLARLATRPLAVCFPWGCATVGGLVRRALGGDPDRAHAALRRLDEQEVWDRLCEIISTSLGVDRKRLKPETSFVYDLGAD
jgi:hypothetical protein